MIIRAFLPSPVAVFLLSCLAATSATATELVLRFASYATERPSEELRKMEPFQKDLEQGLRARGVVAKVDVRIYPTYDEAVEAFHQGQVDFSRFGPVNYVRVKQKSSKSVLLACESHEGSKVFSGVIVVPNASKVRSLSDLRGKKFAFGDPTSTTGRYLPQAELVKAGLTVRDLASYDYLGRHDKVVFAVAAGSFDAGATNERTFKKYAIDKDLRELVRFPSPTQAWLARPDVDREVVKALRATLLSMKGAALEYIDRNGFLACDDDDYEELRKTMKLTRAFGG